MVPNPKNVACVLSENRAPTDQDNHLLILERIAGALLHVTTFAECVAWARALYDEYVWRIEDIVLEHPEDEVASGVRFWSPPKRLPRLADFAFDWQDDLCRSFVMSAAVLKARCCGVAVCAMSDIDMQWLQPSKPLFSQRSIRDKIITARETATHQAIEGSAIEASSTAEEEEEVCRLVSVAASSSRDLQRIQPIHFSKDDPTHLCRPPQHFHPCNFALSCTRRHLMFNACAALSSLSLTLCQRFCSRLLLPPHEILQHRTHRQD